MGQASGVVVEPDIEVTVSENRNLLTVHFRGRITAAALEVRVGQLEEHLQRMGPKFTVFTDLSELEAMELDCVASLTRMMEIFKTRGVGSVVRLIPDPEKDIGFKILSLTHYRRAVKVVTCTTRIEAERALSGGSTSP